jgi:hypothetical protein
MLKVLIILHHGVFQWFFIHKIEIFFSELDFFIRKVEISCMIKHEYNNKRVKTELVWLLNFDFVFLLFCSLVENLKISYDSVLSLSIFTSLFSFFHRYSILYCTLCFLTYFFHILCLLLFMICMLCWENYRTRFARISFLTFFAGSSYKQIWLKALSALQIYFCSMLISFNCYFFILFSLFQSLLYLIVDN